MYLFYVSPRRASVEEWEEEVMINYLIDYDTFYAEIRHPVAL
jgi:hypothetical protein